MLIYSPDSFLIKPGLAFMAFGLLLCSLLARGPVTIGLLGLNIYWMLFGMTATVLLPPLASTKNWWQRLTSAVNPTTSTLPANFAQSGTSGVKTPEENATFMSCLKARPTMLGDSVQD